MSWWNETKKLLSARNIGAILATPFTAGTSLAMLQDNSGRSVIDGLRGTADVEKQNQFNANQAQLNREFQANMSNTAIQRATADAIKAGYNPVLGATNPASTPSGATATSAGLPQSPMNALSEATSATSNLMGTIADVGLKAEQSNLSKAETKKLVEETRWLPQLNQTKIDLDKATTDKERQQILLDKAKTAAIDFDNKMKSMDVEKRSSQYWKELEIYKEQMTQTLVDAGFQNSQIGTFIRGIGNAVNAVSPFTEFTGKSNSAKAQYNYTHVDYNTQ